MSVKVRFGSPLGQVGGKQDSGGWTYKVLHNGSYGTLTLSVNQTAGIGIFRWNGNSAAPPSGTKITATIAPYKSFLFGLASPLRNGDQIVLADANGNSDGQHVSVWLTTSTWSNGSLVFPLDQS